jgi:hypothetical protein
VEVSTVIVAPAGGYLIFVGVAALVERVYDSELTLIFTVVGGDAGGVLVSS